MAVSSLVIGTVVTLTFLVTLTLCMPVDKYMSERSAMLKNDRRSSIGQQLSLSENEKLVSGSMVKEKAALMNESRQGGTPYFPASSFYVSKPQMEKTHLFKLIKSMPKGAALHLHDQAITSLDWLVKNVTYRDHLYMCVNKESLMIFKFFKTPPTADPYCIWTSVQKERKKAGNPDDFDNSIKRNLSLLSTDPLVTYPTITKVWHRFMGYFGQVYGMIFYAPVFKDYFHQALKEFHADNVQYFELRGMMGGIYDLDGATYGMEHGLNIYRTVTQQFVKENPTFLGVKFIMSGLRNSQTNVILKEIKDTVMLRKKYPSDLLGYDLVGQEDPNFSLLHYRDELLYPSHMTPAQKLPYFFHAAETNWQGTDTDYNLIDAILLNTTRIGHGFGLVKHPSLVEKVKEESIAIEVNPISNQLLGLVKDLRNHAMVPLMADNLPLVISSDDPGCWEADPLSHDFYLAFMNMCGEDADLRFLKQLALNSIQYSAMSKAEKDAAMKLWLSEWNKFIETEAHNIKQDTATEDLGHCSEISSASHCKP